MFPSAREQNTVPFGVRCFLFVFSISFRQQKIDKLFRGTGTSSAAPDRKRLCLPVKIFDRKADAVLDREVVNDLQIDLLAGLLEGDGESEPVGEGSQLLDRIRNMEIGSLTVRKVLFDQMSAVAGRIDRKVVGARRDASFEDGP